MIPRVLILFLILFQLNTFGQPDSTWNVMILKKGNQPVMKDNMAEFSPTGFYLYRNCFYDLKLKDETKKTLRLIDIKPDTLIFIGISKKKDADLTEVAKDTFCVDYKNIDKLLLLKDWGSGASKKIKCDDYYFIFHKSLNENRYESKLAFVFSDSKSEIVPRLSSFGITYHYEYGGQLHYYSGIKLQTPLYSEEEKIKALNGILTVLELIVNRRLTITIQNTKKTDDK